MTVKFDHNLNVTSIKKSGIDGVAHTLGGISVTTAAVGRTMGIPRV